MHHAVLQPFEQERTVSNHGFRDQSTSKAGIPGECDWAGQPEPTGPNAGTYCKNKDKQQCKERVVNYTLYTFTIESFMVLIQKCTLQYILTPLPPLQLGKSQFAPQLHFCMHPCITFNYHWSWTLIQNKLKLLPQY